MNLLFIFLDGVGLGEDDLLNNPFASANTPTIKHILSGHRLLSKNAPSQSQFFTFLSIDAQMGVAGIPQSATGQATLLTGINFPKKLGYHYGPKPNLEISKYFNSENNSIFSQITNSGKKASLLNAYPPSYFLGINSRMRNHSVIPLAVTSSGLKLFNQNDLFMGRALSADFTGKGWRDHLNITDTPLLEALEAGKVLGNLSKEYRFSMFEFWETDLIGHKQSLSKALRVVEKLDLVLEGLLQNWDLENDGILITSDHGNIEDLSTRRHTNNYVPAIFIGPPAIHYKYSQIVKNIGNIAPFILDILSD